MDANPNYHPRGSRGRGRSSYRHHSSRFYEGSEPEHVEDLREKLNRKRREEQQRQHQSHPSNVNPPPPDPKYSYLTDPLRDAEGHEKPDTSLKSGTKEYRSPKSRPIAPKPFNIKVEVQTATGERSYVMDKETRLPDIKHVPDFRGRGRGGRGRRRSRGRGFRGNIRASYSGSQARERKEEENWDLLDNKLDKSGDLQLEEVTKGLQDGLQISCERKKDGQEDVESKIGDSENCESKNENAACEEISESSVVSEK